MAAGRRGRCERWSTAAVSCVVFCCRLSIVSTNSCSVDVNRDLAIQEPILVIDGELATPRGSPSNSSAAILFSGGATLACPGRRNRLVGIGRQEVEVSCRRGSVVNLAGRPVPLRDLGCSTKLSATLEASEDRCGGDEGVQVTLGFEVKGKFYDVIKACHNTEKVWTLYSQHVLRGSAINGRQTAEGTPGFESGSLNRGFHIAQLYKQTSVSRTLAQLLGSKPLANRYTSQTFISRGHLSPRADFILQAYQNASFFYVNVAPQWQSVNRGNWLHVEDSVRKHARRHGSELLVITGTHGVMTLPNQQGRPKHIYLHNKGAEHKLPVPMFLWKVVYNRATRSAIAFVTVNNPFLEDVSNNYRLCQDVCRDYGWQFASQHTITLGYTYCCDVPSLRRVVSYIPAIRADSVLKNK